MNIQIPRGAFFRSGKGDNIKPFVSAGQRKARQPRGCAAVHTAYEKRKGSTMRTKRWLVGLLAAGMALGSAATAMAADDDPESDKLVKEEEQSGDKFRSVALTANPLTLIFGRLGLNVEYLPAKHHGIMLNPYYSSYTVSSDASETSYNSFGAELGYHFYTGSRGANGFFVGPSFVFVNSGTEFQCKVDFCSGGAETNITTYGVAVDLGGQYVSKGGFTIGGGVGFMYLKASANTEGSTFFKLEGTLPRALFTVGYSI